jgi:hypothetical protein
MSDLSLCERSVMEVDTLYQQAVDRALRRHDPKGVMSEYRRNLHRCFILEAMQRMVIDKALLPWLMDPSALMDPVQFKAFSEHCFHSAGGGYARFFRIPGNELVDHMGLDDHMRHLLHAQMMNNPERFPQALEKCVEAAYRNVKDRGMNKEPARSATKKGMLRTILTAVTRMKETPYLSKPPALPRSQRVLPGSETSKR